MSDIAVENLAMGWLRDFPDYRDYTPEQDTVPRKLKSLGQKDSVKAMLKKAGITGTTKAAALPASMDLRPW